MIGKGTSIEILNAIRNAASADYQSRVPEATQNNIAAVGNAITSYEPTLNEFTKTLIHKIAMTIVGSKMATNRLAIFKRGDMPFGKTIEEIWVEMAKAEGSFDPTGANPLGRRLSDIKTMYHTENRQDKYVKSVSEAQIQGAFTSAEGVAELTARIVDSIYSGAEHDEYILTKNLLASYKDKYHDYEVAAITDEATAKAFVKTVRKAVADVSFVSDKYNNAGVMTASPVTDLVLLINKDVIAEVDVEVLAKAFNMGKVAFEPDIIVLDDFGSMTDTYAVLVDKDFMLIYDTLKQTKTQENADGLFMNYFYHIWQLYSTSEFHNAIRFTTAISAGKAITSFALTAQTGAATINAGAHTVAITVANGTNVTALKPIIAVSPEASISPASNTAQNFTSPVVYTVTAEDGTTQAWTVTVTVAS